MKYTMTWATLDPSKKYRWDLGRVWKPERLDKKSILFICLNPSTADGNDDDATIRRLVGFSDLWGYGALVVCNLFAWRSTDPRGLYSSPGPVGRENYDYIVKHAAQAGLIVCAWGAHPWTGVHGRHVLWMLQGRGYKTFCFGRTKEGFPKHPVRLPYNTKLIEYT
jgi:hypothetical protein